MITIDPAKPLLGIARPPRPGYAVLPVFSVIDSGTVDAAFVVGDANLLRNIAATTLTEAIVQPDIESAPDFESLNPSIATVDAAGRLTRVANGTASIVATNGFDRQRFAVQISLDGGQVVDAFASWLDGSAAKHCTDNIDGLIAGKSPTDATLQIYSAYDHAAATYTRSATLWCAAHHAALSACNAWQFPTYGQSRAQTAITPRHIVGAAHYGEPITIGGTQRFVAADGTVVNRIVTHTRKIPVSDIQLSLLDSDLPESIVPASILPADWDTYFRAIADPFNFLLGIPCILRNQFGEARIFDISRITTFGSTQFRIPSDAGRAPWYRGLVTGDSGGPAMLLIDGHLVLVTTWTSPSSGTSYQARDWSAEITALDALASINTGYTPRVQPLDAFTAF